MALIIESFQGAELQHSFCFSEWGFVSFSSSSGNCMQSQMQSGCLPHLRCGTALPGTGSCSCLLSCFWYPAVLSLPPTVKRNRQKAKYSIPTLWFSDSQMDRFWNTLRFKRVCKMYSSELAQYKQKWMSTITCMTIPIQQDRFKATQRKIKPGKERESGTRKRQNLC